MLTQPEDTSDQPKRRSLRSIRFAMQRQAWGSVTMPGRDVPWTIRLPTGLFRKLTPCSEAPCPEQDATSRASRLPGSAGPTIKRPARRDAQRACSPIRNELSVSSELPPIAVGSELLNWTPKAMTQAATVLQLALTSLRRWQRYELHVGGGIPPLRATGRNAVRHSIPRRHRIPCNKFQICPRAHPGSAKSRRDGVGGDWRSPRLREQRCGDGSRSGVPGQKLTVLVKLVVLIAASGA